MEGSLQWQSAPQSCKPSPPQTAKTLFILPHDPPGNRFLQWAPHIKNSWAGPLEDELRGGNSIGGNIPEGSRTNTHEAPHSNILDAKTSQRHREARHKRTLLQSHLHEAHKEVRSQVGQLILLGRGQEREERGLVAWRLSSHQGC